MWMEGSIQLINNVWSLLHLCFSSVRVIQFKRWIVSMWLWLITTCLRGGQVRLDRRETDKFKHLDTWFCNIFSLIHTLQQNANVWPTPLPQGPCWLLLLKDAAVVKIFIDTATIIINSNIFEQAQSL